MDVYRRYFKVESGPLVDAAKSIWAINERAKDEYMKIIKELGAKPTYYQRSGKLVALEFDEKPDMTIFKRTDYGYYPKKNCKAGKELNRQLSQIKTKDPKDALEAVGLSGHPTIFNGMTMYYPTITIIPSDPMVIYVAVPWYDEDPEKIEQYKKESAAGTRSDMNFEAILWEPTPEMQEIKKWQVLKHIDEWNSNQK